MNRRSFLQTSAALFASLGIRLDATRLPPGLDLAKFCAESDCGKWNLTAPWTFAGHRYAANPYALLRVRTDAKNDVEQTTIPWGSDARPVFRRIVGGGVVPAKTASQLDFPWADCRTVKAPWPAQDIREGVGDCPAHDAPTQPCPVCRGRREDHDEECYLCDGSGKEAAGVCSVCNWKSVGPGMVIRPCLQQMLPDLFVADWLDTLIRALPGARWNPATREPICFRFSGGEGMVMPQSPPELSDFDQYVRCAE